MHATTLVRLGDPAAHLLLILSTSMRITNLFVYILEIQNSFALLHSSLIREVMIDNIKYFNLAGF